MKPYIKPVFQKVELKPDERLSNTSCRSDEIWCDKDKDGKVDYSFWALY